MSDERDPREVEAEDEAYEALYGRPSPDAIRRRAEAARRALDARSQFAYASTAAGVEPGDDPTASEQAPLAIDEVTSDTLREVLLGGVALAHGRVLSGRFGTGPGEQAGLEKLLTLVERFPELAKAMEVVATYSRPVARPAPAAASTASAPVSEKIRRLRIATGRE